jgi:hypothetical protein
MESQTQISSTSDAELTPGAVLRSRYVLEEVIGRGGHCVVFRAKDLHRVNEEEPDGEYIALKVLHPSQRHNERAIARLAREFRQMQILAHPGIARVFDLDCDSGTWFISMELVAGQTVNDWMRESVEPTDAIRLIGECCAALDYAHSMGIVHGDLKPSNILRGVDGRAKLIDFGSVASRSNRTEAEQNASLSATPSYASPQVLAGMRPEIRDDIFSMACVSYGILSAGQRPFGDKSSLDAHRARLCPAVIEGMPVEVFAVLVHSLSGDREHRPTSAGQLYRDLQGTESDSLPAVSSAVSSRRSGRMVMQRVSIAGIAAGVLAASVLLLPAAQRLIAGPAASQTSVTAAPGVAALVPPADASDAQAATPVIFTSSDAADGTSGVLRGSGVVTFESAALVAGSAQSLVAIPLKRLQSTRGAASVEWQIESGSARPNVDYEPLKPQVVKFNDGESARSLFIPLLRAAADSDTRPPRSFTVQLRSLGGGARLGAVTSVKVTIVPQPMYSGISEKVARE